MSSEESSPPELVGHAGKYVADLRDVSVCFEGTSGTDPKVAVANLTLAIPEREFLALVGQSGCGKTTVLNVLAGLQEPTSGEATVLGADPRSVRTSIGYMFARDALLAWRTAQRNVEFGLELRGLAKDERRARARRELAELGLAGSEHLLPWQLSQGMRQRVALARTWAMDPALVLMDEPFGALDALTRGAVQDIFLETWSAHRRTVVFVTHDLDEALQMADRVAVMHEGRIIDEVHVPFDRPRDLARIRAEPLFAELRERLFQRLVTPESADDIAGRYSNENDPEVKK